MTNPRDLENGMVGDPVDHAVIEINYKGDELFAEDEPMFIFVRQKKYNYAKDDAEGLLSYLISKGQGSYLWAYIEANAGQLAAFSALMKDDGFNDAEDMFEQLGAESYDIGAYL